MLQVLISWECTMAHAIPWDTFFPWIQKDTARARFVSGISKASIEHEHKLNRTGWIACDPLAVAVAIRPELIEEVQVRDKLSHNGAKLPNLRLPSMQTAVSDQTVRTDVLGPNGLLCVQLRSVAGMYRAHDSGQRRIVRRSYCAVCSAEDSPLTC